MTKMMRAKNGLYLLEPNEIVLTIKFLSSLDVESSVLEDDATRSDRVDSGGVAIAEEDRATEVAQKL